MSEQFPAVMDRTEIIGDARPHVVPALAVVGERAALSLTWNSTGQTSATRTHAAPTVASARPSVGRFQPGEGKP
jgi:hypothetical protein